MKFTILNNLAKILPQNNQSLPT